MDPQLSPGPVSPPLMTLAFPHSWRAEILPKRPLIRPLRCYTYPREAEEVERGALEVMIQPGGKALKFLATFALGFADPSTPTGVWSCPDPEDLCAVAGGYAYIVRTSDPDSFTHIALRPVFQPLPLPDRGLLLFAGHQSMLAWGRNGEAWQTRRLSSEGIHVSGIQGDAIYGFGWDMITDREIPFTVDLRTGESSHPASDSAR